MCSGTGFGKGGPVEEIRPGDIIWVPPGEKHWHGASPTAAMTHIVIQEQPDGSAVVCGKNVRSLNGHGRRGWG